MRASLAVALFACAVLVTAGCAKQQTQTTAAEPTATAIAEATAAPELTSVPTAEAPAAGATTVPGEPTPEPTATPNPNLLSRLNGTILRAYPATLDDPSQADTGFSVQDSDAGPFVFVYELPGTATLSRLSAQVVAKDESGKGARVAFAVSTTSATAGFSDVGTIASNATDAEQSVSLPAPRARWVRVTVTRDRPVRPAEDFGVYGTIATPASLPVAGTYVLYKEPYAGGAFASAPSEKDPWYLQVATGRTGWINGEMCFSERVGDTFPGTLVGRTWLWHRAASEAPRSFVVNDEASLVISTSGDGYWIRSQQRPAKCAPVDVGSGPNTVLVLQSPSWEPIFPATQADWAKTTPGVRYSLLGAGIVDDAALASASTVWLNGLCEADSTIASGQGQAIADWVAAGHKLLITDSDMCSKHVVYSFLPYPFESDNPGASGAKGDRLIQVEDDALGTSDKNDEAHFFEPNHWVQESNQLGDANTVTTHDPHWCGHLFGTNVHHVNGFMQMYALYGKGVIIYDGFDHDDDEGASYQRVRSLEIALPSSPDLPCTQKASLGFVIQPDRFAKFAPGKATTVTVPMELLANHGWKGHVTVTTSGDFTGTVTPSAFDVDGTTQAMKIAVSIPASAKPGDYAVIVNGDGGGGATASATLHLHADVSLVKQIKTSRRIRIYGIHFDVDKATIKPQSEPVIAQIAQVMKANPKWRFRVEGHTDSDGGLQHNAVLSQHRAESVVNDLVTRYHIARGRLVPKGFGYSKPVAPNTTTAGKALNRRVELFLLNPGA